MKKIIIAKAISNHQLILHLEYSLITMSQYYSVDFTTKTLTYYKDRALKITYANPQNETTKIHPLFYDSESTLDSRLMGQLAAKYLTHVEICQYRFGKSRPVGCSDLFLTAAVIKEYPNCLEFIDGTSLSQMFHQVNLRMLKDLTSEQITKLPGLHPRVEKLSTDEVENMSAEERSAYKQAVYYFENFGYVSHILV